MSGQRQEKIARLLQRELGEIFLRESHNMFRGYSLTVTVVRVTPDLGFARVYFSFFHPGADPQEVLEIVKSRKGAIKNKLGQKIRNQVRKIPDLEFHYDDSADYSERIDELLKE